MISEASLLTSRSPELVSEIAALLKRIGKDDLALKVDRFAVERVQQDRQRQKLSFFGTSGRRAYSMELDAKGVQITVDVSADDDLVAVHVRPAED